MLEFAEITKSFGTRRVLDGLTFRVRPGEVYGLLGPNGAGKSTTFNIICNLLVPDSGTVLVWFPRTASV
jgi:ABC-2 type transport system ATP-binding protein